MSRVSEKKEREAIFENELIKTHREPKPFIPGETAIPPSGKLIDDEEIVAMVDALDDGSRPAQRRIRAEVGEVHW